MPTAAKCAIWSNTFPRTAVSSPGAKTCSIPITRPPASWSTLDSDTSSRRIVFTGAVAQQVLAESPIAAARHEAPFVDKDTQRAAFFAVGELAHAGLELLRIGRLP